MFDDIELALQAAEHGMGVALARHSMVFDAIQQGRLERVLDVGLRGSFRHYIVAPRNRIDSAAELIVIDWLEGQARQFSADGAAELAGLRGGQRRSRPARPGRPAARQLLAVAGSAEVDSGS